MYRISTESIRDIKKFIWHYRKNNKEYGPFTYEDILEKVKAGEIGPEDYVLRFGNRKFVKASEVQGLFDVTVIADSRTEAVRASGEEGSQELNKPTYPEENKHSWAGGPLIAKTIAAAAGLCLLAWILTELF